MKIFQYPIRYSNYSTGTYIMAKTIELYLKTIYTADIDMLYFSSPNDIAYPLQIYKKHKKARYEGRG